MLACLLDDNVAAVAVAVAAAAVVYFRPLAPLPSVHEFVGIFDVAVSLKKIKKGKALEGGRQGRSIEIPGVPAFY